MRAVQFNIFVLNRIQTIVESKYPNNACEEISDTLSISIKMNTFNKL